MVQLKLLCSRNATCHQKRFDISKLNKDRRKQFCTELQYVTGSRLLQKRVKQLMKAHLKQNETGSLRLTTLLPYPHLDLSRNLTRFVESVATEKEASAQKQEQGTIYRITRQICGGQRRGKAPIFNKQGALMTTDKEQEKRWVENFQQVLNKEALEELAVAQDAEEDLDISIEPSTKEEIMEAIKDL